MSAAPPNKPNPPPPIPGVVPSDEASAAKPSVEPPRSPVPPAFRTAAAPKPAPPPPPPPPKEAEQERDLWWGGYSSRTMIPSFAVCMLLTAAFAGLGWYLFQTTFRHHGDLLRYAVYAVAGTIWVFQLVRWGYRMVALNYRLTTRRLFYSDGFLYPPRDAIELARVTRVLAEQTWMEKQLGVGSVRIILENDKGPNQPVVLTGIHLSQRIGETIERAVRKVRGES